MRVIVSIIRHEIKTRFFTWPTLIFFLMLVFQGIWYTKGAFDYYVNDNVLMNAPAIFYKNFAGLGMLMIIIIAITTGGVLYKDIQHKTAQWVYSFPVQEKHFFIGKYIAALVYLLIVATGFFVGMLLVPYSGIGEAHRFGPAPIGQMWHGVLLFLLPNILLYVSLIFTSVILFRQMAVGYLVTLLMVVLFIVMQVSYESGGGNTLLYVLADPSGYVSVENYSMYLTTHQKNTAYISLSGYVLANRIIWMSITAIFFGVGYFTFSFKKFINASSAKNRKLKLSDVEVSTKAMPASKKITISQTTIDYIKKLFTLSKLELLHIIRPLSFTIILGVMLLMILMQNLLFNSSYYIGKEVALSSNMTFFRLPWGVFIVMLLMIWSGELFFKDKTIKIWQITDSLPVPVWVTQVSRLLASIGLAFILCIFFIAIAAASQVMMGGGENIEWMRFVEDILGFRWGFLNFVLYICLVFFVAGLTGSRFLTHILCVGYFFITILSLEMGLLEQRRYLYGMVPGSADFSELSGYGIANVSARWFAAMWAMLAIAFVLLGILFWQRGVQQAWYKKITSRQLSPLSKIIVVGFLAGFGLFQFIIYKQVNAKGNFTAKTQQETADADYEKKYQYLQYKSQPRYKQVALEIDFYPQQRTAIYQAHIVAGNTFTDTLYLTYKDFVTVQKITLHGVPLQLLKEDKRQHIAAYKIPAHLQKDSVLPLYLQAIKQYQGFTQGALQPDLTFNGSFGTIKEFLPVIGYDAEKEIHKNRIRQDNGLPKIASRMSNVHDSVAYHQDAYSPDADWVTGSIIISTPAAQKAIAPGRWVKEWKHNNRNYFHFIISQPAPFNWCVGAATYKQFIKHNTQGCSYCIDANPRHVFNISLYDTIIQKSIAFFKKNIPGFSVHELRVVEINRWNKPVYTFSNVIAISEKEGWIANTSAIAERAYIYQTIGSQMANQWLQQHIHLANVQGVDMFRMAIPEALGLLFVKNTLGEEAVEAMIKKKKDKYAKDRNNEANTEPALLYADGADYLEANKGAIAMYEAIQETGITAFMQALASFTTTAQPVSFLQFYKKIEPAIAPKTKQLITKK